MFLLKQSTAVTRLVGPILDPSGVEYTSAVIGDLNITKNGTTAAMAAAATLTHSHNGNYLLAFTTGNTDTLGELQVSVNKSGYQMPPHRWEILTATTFDALVTNAANAAGGLQDVQRIGGVLQTAGDVFNAVTNIAVTGSALNAIAGARTLNTGTETNTYTSTQLLDGAYHTITAAGGVISIEYTGTLPNTFGQITGLLWRGYLAGLGNSAAVYFWNYNTSAYDQVEQVSGISGTPTIASETEVSAVANNNHTGAGGTWKIKIAGTGMTLGVLNTDLLSVAYSVVLTPPTNWSALSITSGGKVDVGAINGSSEAAVRLDRSCRSITKGTVGSSSTVTSVISSACDPSGGAVDQFRGEILQFDKDTTTAALRGQKTDITASTNSATPTFTVSALTTAPASGDTFTIG